MCLLAPSRMVLFPRPGLPFPHVILGSLTVSATGEHRHVFFSRSRKSRREAGQGQQLLSNVVQHQALPTGGVPVRKLPFQSHTLAVESPGLTHREGYLLMRLPWEVIPLVTSASIASGTLGVCPPLAARESGYFPGHTATLESDGCCVRKRGMGPGLQVQGVPQNDAVVIQLILFGYNPLEIIGSPKMIVLHVALQNSFGFKVI